MQDRRKRHSRFEACYDRRDLSRCFSPIRRHFSRITQMFQKRGARPVRKQTGDTKRPRNREKQHFIE